MWMLDKAEFDKLVESCGNRYMATMYVANSARKLGEGPYSLLESKLISWALSGNHPELLHKRAFGNSEELYIINNYLCYIEDDKIRKSIIRSYRKSIKEKHMVFEYARDMEDHEKARMRVLMRMIWYEI